MFGIKKKKEEVKYTANGVRKIKVSDLPPEKQERVLADLRKMGDEMVATFQAAMEGRLETARTAVDQGINNSDNRDDR